MVFMATLVPDERRIPWYIVELPVLMAKMQSWSISLSRLLLYLAARNSQVSDLLVCRRVFFTLYIDAKIFWKRN